VASVVPREPNWQGSSGKAARVRTFEDLVKTPYDEDLFEHYATAQLAVVETRNGKVSELGQAGIFQTVHPSPDKQYVLVARVHRPFSYLYPVFDYSSLSCRNNIFRASK
jgi:hypothetical protein